MKHIIYTILTISLISLSSCSGNDAQVIHSEDPILVKTQKVGQENLPDETFSASGKLVSAHVSNVSTRVMGYITKINVQIGQKVNKGQTLINIHNSDIQAKESQANAQISQAQTQFNLAQKDFERFKNLFENQSASQKELDDMTARMEMARANLQVSQQMKNEVRSQYSYTNIIAPISGIITQKHVNESDMAHPGMPLLTIETTSNIQAEVMVSEVYINQIQRGMKVKINQRNSHEVLEGIINEISYSAAQTGGQYIVKVDIEADNILPGMYVNVIFPIENKKESTTSTKVFLPKDALIHQGQLTGIYAISQNETAILRWLITGQELGDQVEILSGLNPQEEYIISADGKLFNGAQVRLQ